LRRLLHWTFAAGAIAALMLSTGPAAAKSCSDRLKVCQGYCAKSFGGSPACLAKCDQYREECLSSGCWESKVVAKECGFARQ
jgi:hypothetical protein